MTNSSATMLGTHQPAPHIHTESTMKVFIIWLSDQDKSDFIIEQWFPRREMPTLGRGELKEKKKGDEQTGRMRNNRKKNVLVCDFF